MKQSQKIFLLLGLSILVAGSAVFFYVEGSVKNSSVSGEGLGKSLQCKDCNLVIISLTNTRKNNMGIYGYERNTTPNINKFFENALLFENAFAPASWTLPVATSLFTSLFPDTHGVMDRYDGSRLSDDVLTLAEIFRQNDYKTAGFTGGGDYNRQFNHAQGFDVFVDRGDVRSPLSYAGTDNSLPEAIDWLNKLQSKDKFFLFVQGYDTHCPFTPKEPFSTKFIGIDKSKIDYKTCLWTFGRTEPVYEKGVKFWPVKTMANNDGTTQDIKLIDEDVKYMEALYDGEIAQADSNLSELFKIFEERGLIKNTIFVFMSEHGDMLGEHGRFMRGGPLRGTFYDPVINFPLIIKHPSISSLQKINVLVQTVDLMPTLLDMIGLNDEQGNKRQGKSLIYDLRGSGETNEYVYAASSYNAVRNIFFDGFSRVEAIRNKEWKLIREVIASDKDNLTSGGGGNEESYELYNILNDPEENNNLIDQEKEMVSFLKEKLKAWNSKIK